jgi:hypothetical protein
VPEAFPHADRIGSNRDDHAATSGSKHAKQQCDNEHDEENVEQDLRDFRRAGRDAGKAEYGGNDRYDEKDDSVVKHGDLPFIGFVGIEAGFEP